MTEKKNDAKPVRRLNRRSRLPAVLLALVAVTAGICLVAGLAGVPYVKGLNQEIRDKMEGRRWSLPAAVYARPLELFSGLKLTAELLEEELQLAGYRHEDQENGQGSYARKGQNVRLVTRDFHFLTGFEPSRHLSVSFAGGEVSSLIDLDGGDKVSFAELDPARIGSFHPQIHEERILLTRQEIPELLVNTLLTVEDRDFYSHHGIAPLGILRALAANIRAGKTVQGGSTLTQQLIKNLFLGRERTLPRKIQEAVMALLIERSYTKDEILTTYVNEVFLGQDGNRAIHGFALASQFYFRRDLQDLRPDQIALLVGMIKGPSYFDPRRNPVECLERRNMVLEKMSLHNLIGQGLLDESMKQPLIGFAVQKGGMNRFPAFIDLVRQQLAGEYREEDLKSEGLQIITTLDPKIQLQVEKGLAETIQGLEAQPKRANLEGAVVVTARETGEVLAVAGGKEPQDFGFNRALHANRPIGSLVKPAVYLTALEEGYNLASPLDDTALTFDIEGSKPWQPANYDKREHGTVPLYSALAHSYNLATVRLGMDLGLTRVIATLKKLGMAEEPQPYPSLLLGAVGMSPLAVTEMYQTIASGGFFTSLRAISGVMAADHSVLNRYGLAVEQRFNPAVSFFLAHAMQRTVTEGTATSLLKTPLRDYAIAGKTGTTDDLRDSWFAGFTGDHLMVVWLGRDDNTPCNLTGATGALKAWTNIMEGIPSSTLQLPEPAGINWVDVDKYTLRAAYAASGTTTRLPFIAGDGPPEEDSSPLDSVEQGVEDIRQEARGVLDTINGWLN